MITFIHLIEKRRAFALSTMCVFIILTLYKIKRLIFIELLSVQP